MNTLKNNNKKNNSKKFVKKNIFKIIFSLVFFILSVLYLFSKYFNSRIDAVFIFLMILGFLPWIAKYIKSIEILGIKSELVSDDTKEKIDEELSEIHSDNTSNADFNTYMNKEKDLNYLVSANDSVSRLVLYRVEIENKLKSICEYNCISYSRKDSLRNLIFVLRKKEILPLDISAVMLDLLPILNDAVHSNLDNIRISDVDWIINKCIYIIEYLNFLLNSKKRN